MKINLMILINPIINSSQGYEISSLNFLAFGQNSKCELNKKIFWQNTRTYNLKYNCAIVAWTFI